MKINISSQHVNPEASLQEFITKKLSKLAHFDENLSEAEVILDLEKGRVPNFDSKVVKVKLFGRNGDYFAEKTASSFEQATLEVVDALKRQILKAKDKRR